MSENPSLSDHITVWLTSTAQPCALVCMMYLLAAVIKKTMPVFDITHSAVISCNSGGRSRNLTIYLND